MLHVRCYDILNGNKMNNIVCGTTQRERGSESEMGERGERERKCEKIGSINFVSHFTMQKRKKKRRKKSDSQFSGLTVSKTYKMDGGSQKCDWLG